MILEADWATDRVLGLAEFGHTFATLNGAQNLRKELENLKSGRITVVTSSPLYKCPAAPYEAALLIDSELRKRGVRDKVQVLLCTAESAPMPTAGKNVSEAVKSILTNRSIVYRPAVQITGVEHGKIYFGDEDEKTDLLVYMPPIAAPRVISDSQLAQSDGWIYADANTLRTEFDNVYAIGDNTQFLLGIGKPLPRAGVFAHAHAQALAVADSIIAKINGRESMGVFDGHGSCFI